MKTLETNKATESLGEYARKIGKEPVILTEGGRPVAALVSIRNADNETVNLSVNPRFNALIERSRTHMKSKGSVTGDDMRKRLGVSSVNTPKSTSKNHPRLKKPQ